MKLSLIIPAYNESEGVAETAAKLRLVMDALAAKSELDVIFVDDGSKDNTRQLLETAFSDDTRVRVIPHDVNRGLGAAVRTGFQHATGDIIVTTDFDGTYPFSTIPSLIDLLISTNADIASASPYHPQGRVDGVPPYRLLFSFGASLCYRLLVKWGIYTWTGLYRAYRRRVTDTILFESSDFLSLVEILVNAVRLGYSVVEFPTTLYRRTFGQSSLKIARVTRAHLRYLSHLLTLRLTGQFAVHPQTNVG